MQYFAIAAIDLLIWSAFALFLGRRIYDGLYTEYYVEWASEMLGCFFGGVVGRLLKKQRNKIKESFENLSFLYFTVILIVLHQFTTFINEILVAQSVVLKHS